MGIVAKKCLRKSPGRLLVVVFSKGEMGAAMFLRLAGSTVRFL